MQKHVKIYTAKPSGEVIRHEVKPSTTDRINQLKKELGMNTRPNKEESFLQRVRLSFNALNNPNLTACI